MKNKEKTLKLLILGKTYTVVTDENEDDIEAAIDLMDDLFEEKIATSGLHGQLSERVAAIAALQMAVELIKMKKIVKTYEHACFGLANTIEQNL